MYEARSIREFWFGRLPLSASALNKRMCFWFGGDSSKLGRRCDADICGRFGALLQHAGTGEFSSWADGARGRLSLIILLDQFPRHMFRGSARAFAYDKRALALTLSGLQSAADAALEVIERLFFCMPLQHAESREAQQESLSAYQRLLVEAPPELRGPFAGAMRAAENHHAIIERFGRFPYRNATLGRADTPEETDWLRQGGARFGQ
jgi:uncharacterized protein (DUF924 family)